MGEGGTRQREKLQSTYATQQEINTPPPPRCSLRLSLPPLMRDLFFLAEGPHPTPSRSQMIVFAAWGPDPASPDPVTGTVEPVHGESHIKKETGGERVSLLLNHCDILPGNVVFSLLGSRPRSEACTVIQCAQFVVCLRVCVCASLSCSKHEPSRLNNPADIFRSTSAGLDRSRSTCER